MASSNFVSFKDLKQRSSIEHVLRHYNLFEGLHLRSRRAGITLDLVLLNTT
jgi:hypothetical protein